MMRRLAAIPPHRRLPLALAAVLIVILAVVGFSFGRSARSDPARADAARAEAKRAAFRTSRAAALKAARKAGYDAGYEQGAKTGHLEGKRAARKRVKRELERSAAGITSAPSPSPYTDQGGTPAPNPSCPAGQEPNDAGGCVPYDEENGQLEPKINDPDCYKPDPPDACF